MAILGAGPAGASLAAYLARHRARGGGAGFEVTLFDGGTRPPIVVGESLVPAVVPFLQRLGIEEEVASYSTLKPGATFRFGLEDVLMFRFDEVRGARTTYSYNVPRDRFDASVRDAALAAGARLVPDHARVERDGFDERVGRNLLGNFRRHVTNRHASILARRRLLKFGPAIRRN